MVTIDDEMKAKISNMMDSDGKLIITDDMPDDLKSAIQYLNDNNVNILDNSTDEEYEPDEEDLGTDEFDDEMDSDDDSFDDFDDSESDYSAAPAVDNIQEDEDASVDDLNDLF